MVWHASVVKNRLHAIAGRNGAAKAFPLPRLLSIKLVERVLVVGPSLGHGVDLLGLVRRNEGRLAAALRLPDVRALVGALRLGAVVPHGQLAVVDVHVTEAGRDLFAFLQEVHVVALLRLRPEVIREVVRVPHVVLVVQASHAEVLNPLHLLLLARPDPRLLEHPLPLASFCPRFYHFLSSLL